MELLFQILNETKSLNQNLTVILIPTREQVYPERLNKAVEQLGYNLKKLMLIFQIKK